MIPTKKIEDIILERWPEDGERIIREMEWNDYAQGWRVDHAGEIYWIYPSGIVF